MEFINFIVCPECHEEAFVTYVNVNTHDSNPETAVQVDGHCVNCGAKPPLRQELSRCT